MYSVYNQSTVSEIGDSQPLYAKISAHGIRSCYYQPSTGNRISLICYTFASGLHIRAALERLPLRQLGFLFPRSFVFFQFTFSALFRYKQNTISCSFMFRNWKLVVYCVWIFVTFTPLLHSVSVNIRMLLHWPYSIYRNWCRFQFNFHGFMHSIMGVILTG